MTSIVVFSCIYCSPHYTHSTPDDDYKIVETLNTKMISILRVTIVVYLIKMLSRYLNVFDMAYLLSTGPFAQE